MEGLLRIWSPSSASWIMWVLLGWLLLALCVGLLGSDMLVLFRSLFSKSERIYIERNTHGYLYMVIARMVSIGVIALVGYMLIYDGGDVAVMDYILVMGIAAGMYVVQWLLLRGVGYVFLRQKQVAIAMEQRAVVCNAMVMPLWSIGLLMLYTEQMTRLILCGIVFVGYLVVLSVKFVQLFYQNILSIGYMILYVVSLEVLPLCAALLWAQKMI